MQEIRTLHADEIEVKIKQVTANGAFALLYKTARTDMALLDEVFGASNWTNDYKEIKGNLYCGIAVCMADTKEWVWRWDCGIESREDDGNEKKGEASDAFKRAGTRWGIGRELYTAPPIFLRIPTKATEVKGKMVYLPENKYSRYSVASIEYDENRRICRLLIVDENGEAVFSYPSRNSKSTDSGSKAVPSGKQTGVEQKPAQSAEDRLKAAMERKIIYKGEECKLGDLPAETLQALAQRAKEKDLRDDMLRVMQYKFAKAAKETEEDLPFKDVAG